MSARNRIWLIAIVMFAVAVIALGWFVGVSPRLDEAKQADSDRAEVESTIGIYEQQLAKLKSDFEGIDDLRAQLSSIEAKLPQTPEYAEYLALMTGLTEGTGAGVSAVTWGTPTLVSADSAADTGAPAQDSGAAPAGSLILLPITFTVDGQVPSIQAYLALLQANDRYLMITNVALQKSTNPKALGGTFTASVQGSVFLVVGPETIPAVDTPVAPAAETPAG